MASYIYFVLVAIKIPAYLLHSVAIGYVYIYNISCAIAHLFSVLTIKAVSYYCSKRAPAERAHKATITKVVRDLGDSKGRTKVIAR